MFDEKKRNIEKSALFNYLEDVVGAVAFFFLTMAFLTCGDDLAATGNVSTYVLGVKFPRIPTYFPLKKFVYLVVHHHACELMWTMTHKRRKSLLRVSFYSPNQLNLHTQQSIRERERGLGRVLSSCKKYLNFLIIVRGT